MIRFIIPSLALFIISCSGSNALNKFTTKNGESMLQPEQVSPDVYKVLFDNKDVKVLEVTFAPGQSDNMHDHYPMTIHVLEGGKVQGTLPDGTVNEREIPDGFTGHQLQGVRHQIKNIGDNTMKIILVERKRTQSTNYSKEELILPEEVSPDRYQVLLDNEDVKVVMVTFPPGKGDNMHEHGVTTYYAVKGGKMQNTLADGTVSEMEIPDGFASHGDKLVKHQMMNIGEEMVKVLLVEHKKLEIAKL